MTTKARILIGIATIATVSLLVLVSAVSSFAASPWLHLTSGAHPTYLQPGSTNGEIVATVENLGDANASGENSPIEISDVLPPGLTAVGIAASIPVSNTATPLPCSLETLTCTLTGTLPIYGLIEVRIKVSVNGAKTGAPNKVEVSGGEMPAASIERPIVVNDENVPFGVENHSLSLEDEGGAPDTQAGSHPFQLTDALNLNQTADTSSLSEKPKTNPAEPVKDLFFKLPPGLIGNPTAITRCTIKQFFARPPGVFENECPAQSAIGVVVITVREPKLAGAVTFTVPLFNLEPSVGEPARFGFYVLLGNAPVFLDTSIRTGGDYGITVKVGNITQTAAFFSSAVTFWGVPGDPRHDNARGWSCLAETRGEKPESPCDTLAEPHPPAFLSVPTSCTGQPLQTSIEADSWLAAENVKEYPTEPMPVLDGCNRLPFGPSIKVTPDGTAGSTPTGLNVDVHSPQEESLNAAGLAESNVKTITVALPEGVSVNPAGADGLEACSEQQVGFTGVDPSSGADLFTSGLPAPKGALAEPFCSDASKIGTVKIKTPILPNAVEGSVYLAEQNRNPFGSLIAMYIIAEDPVSGVLLKIPGEVKLTPSGQIISTFANSPQAPFEDAELHFFGGDRAPLATPAHCGAYTTVASMAPWSGGQPVDSSSAFTVNSGPNGGPCHDPLPFDPSLTAGTTSIQAGGFSPFTMTMSREDGQQSLQAIRLHMPPGLSGLLSSVRLCGEAQASAGTCGPESQIGETIVSVGLGGDPFSVTGGKVFITEGYEGAPYGLSIVNPAKAGPFDLGTVVVRAKIEVDPLTAALTITSDNSGPYKIPTILDGIPLQIKHVNVTINRPGFTFNPTNCDPQTITGSLSSTEGATSALSVPLQVTNCAVLGFKPAFSVSTNGKTSRATGASLHVKLVYPKAPFGSQANIKSVKVDLPKQLPSQLRTLQHACPDYTFSQNPAGCSPESRIGTAKATTPLLPVPLTGPVYFVSHAGLKFPELVIVLSGYGTTIDLHAETFINPQGITSSTFRTIPDAPVGTFELTLPQGKYPALAAPDNHLCRDKLVMPTAFTAQNGAVIKQNTPITVTGCAKAKKTKTKSKHNAKHKAKKK
jgi:hypothetical protein